MRFLDKLAIVALLVLAVAGKVISGDQETERRPDPRIFTPPIIATSPEPSGPLPSKYRDAPTFTIDVGTDKKTSTGTAFSVGQGLWVTARHVTDGCDLIVLKRGPRSGIPVRNAKQEGNADITILKTDKTAPSLPVAKTEIAQGQKGWSFGFPHGEPGDVYGTMIGRAKMRARGRYSSLEPVIAWTQRRRIPEIGTDLSGISGGPWLDQTGRVIGVHVAGAPRRGRSFSTDPSTLLAALDRSGIKPSSGGYFRLNEAGFSQSGDMLRQQFTVSKVLCLVGDKWKRRIRQS
jgi:serine protease Do